MSKINTERFKNLQANIKLQLAQEIEPAAPEPVGNPPARPRLLFIKPDRIHRRSPVQTRAPFNPEQDPEDAEFARSVQVHGVVQPVVVYRIDGPDEDGMVFELVSGHRRLDAALYAHLDIIPAMLLSPDSTEQGRALLTALENLQRKDLRPMEKASQLRALMEAYQYSQREIAGLVGLSEAQVSRLLSLLQAPPEVQEAVNNGQISIVQAQKLAQVSPDERAQLLKVAGQGMDLGALQAEKEKVGFLEPPSEIPNDPALSKNENLPPIQPVLLPATGLTPPSPAQPLPNQRIVQQVNRLLGSQAKAFWEAFAAQPELSLVSEAHLPMVALFWKTNEQKVSASLSIYRALTKPLRAEMQKVLQALDHMSVLYTHFNYQGAGKEMGGYIRQAAQDLLESSEY